MTNSIQSASLQANNLSCIRDDRELFTGLDFSLASGELLLVEGRNGSGKTTLLRILCGIRRQDDGEISWCGESIDKLGAEYHAELAYVGHADGIKLDLTVEENLQQYQILGSGAGMTMDEVLERVSLSGFDDVLARNLSAGQRRRLALARLLVTGNQLWILDEPVTSLDSDGRAIFHDLLESHINSGGMVVMSSHHEVPLNNIETKHLDLSA